MPIRLALYDRSYTAIQARLDALSLDLEVVTFDAAGQYQLNGRQIAPEEMEVDYLWLRLDIAKDGAQDTVFDMAQRTKRVGVLQTYNAGLDHPVYRSMAMKGTRLSNSSAQGIAIAEYVFAQALSVLHPIETQRAMQAAGEWATTPFREISQTRWLIVGYGPIGSALTQRLRAFEAGIDVIRRSGADADLADRTGALTDARAFAPDADVVVLACPLTDETRGMADAAFFAAMRPGAILINVARGGLIDDAALLAGLDAGRPKTAILDVFHTEPLPQDDPLWRHPKVRITPHTSFAGDGGQGRWDQLFLDNIDRFARGAPLIREVDPASL